MRSSPRSRSSMTIPRGSSPTFANPIGAAIVVIPIGENEGLARIPQRHKTDCATCSVAMVLHERMAREGY